MRWYCTSYVANNYRVCRSRQKKRRWLWECLPWDEPEGASTLREAKTKCEKHCGRKLHWEPEVWSTRWSFKGNSYFAYITKCFFMGGGPRFYWRASGTERAANGTIARICWFAKGRACSVHEAKSAAERAIRTLRKDLRKAVNRVVHKNKGEE